MFSLVNRFAQRTTQTTTSTMMGANTGLRLGRNLLPTQMAFFSEETKEAAAAQPTQEEVDANRHEWGIKYNDECLKFEKEWEEIARRVEDENFVYIESELSELQKKKVDMLADKILDLNMFEQRYMHAMLAHRIQRSSGINMMKLNLDWPSLKQDGQGTWPPANPNWFRQQELMS